MTSASWRWIVGAVLLAWCAAQESDHEGGSSAEEAGHEKLYAAVASAVTITVLIFLSIVFESGTEWLRESTEDTNMPFINTIFSELTTLGFIGSVLFVMSKSGYLSQISKALFGPNKSAELEETIELLHMALFLFIVIFLMLCLTLLKFGVQVQNEFREFERRAPYVQVVVADYCLASEPATSWRQSLSWSWNHERTKRKREMVYVSLRRRFVDFRSNHPDPHRAYELAKDFQLERDTRFPFNEYLTIISGEVMAKLIQIDGITWIALEVCIISLLATCWLVGPDNEVFVFGIAGGFLVLLNQFVYGRIRHMRQLLTPPILFKKAERYRANLAWRAQHNLAPLVPTPPSIPSESVPLLPSEDKNTSLVDFVPPYVHDLPQGGVNLTIPQLQDAQKRLLGGGTGNGVVLALFSTRLVFLFTALHLSVFLLRTLPHLVNRTDMDVVAKALCMVVSILPSCIVTSMSIVIARDGLFAFNVEALKAPRVINKVMRIVKARQTLRTLRFIAEMKLYLREHENDHVTSDSTSPDDHAAPTNGQEKAWGGSRGFSLKSKPHQFVMKELPSFHLDDSDWGNMSVLSPRSRMAVEVPMSPMHDPPPFPDTPLGHRSHHPTKDQFAAETERREINSIFSLIDKDKSGKIYTYEMEGFLQQISPDMTSDQIQTIMDDLDKSKSGGVIFDDFEAWCRTHIHEHSSKHSKHQLIREVFKMIDTDKSGYITVDEFISIFKSLGQSLDHEDVRELIYQMDRNNDGKIDLEEFQKMLHKHAV
ncbi:hypothetical protein H310_11289 [Aphanomyces invadans]|uniref:Calmodulin n=1 Tax=Aphanomyces invadans TaxID=157072 RepID=A0A024TN67_9STRA|nr:hypothetical protein H310_11289 [Aphanomyces invadans]ETV95414.1 hypothetical protein H310_11289 [Aphanomyces invadans]|eukprot:XP_008876115.1 hypothetical protein H310_11289 [Aphanomyces invadans]